MNNKFFNFIKSGDIENVKLCIEKNLKIPSYVHKSSKITVNDNMSALELSVEFKDNEIFKLIYEKLKNQDRKVEKTDALINSFLNNNFEAIEIILESNNDLVSTIDYKNIINVIQGENALEHLKLLDKYSVVDNIKDESIKSLDKNYELKEFSKNKILNIEALDFIIKRTSIVDFKSYLQELSTSYDKINQNPLKSKEVEERIVKLKEVLANNLIGLNKKDFNEIKSNKFKEDNLYKEIIKEAINIRLYHKIFKSINCKTAKKVKI